MATPAEMSLDSADLRKRVERFQTVRDGILAQVRQVIVGQDEVLDQILTALFVGGHCLITGLPGTAKTLMVRTIAQTLGLALRELCENALKHGAFSKGAGEVSLVWRIDQRGADPVLEMTWRERGGPHVDSSPVSGFGTVVIERLTGAGLNASSNLSFEPEGVVWRLLAPLKDIVKTSDQIASA